MGVLNRRSKERNSLKSSPVQPILWVCKGFVVVLSKGCGVIGEYESLNLERYDHLPWYF